MSTHTALTATIVALVTLGSTTPIAAQQNGVDGFRREAANTFRNAARSEADTAADAPEAKRELIFSSRRDSTDWVRGKNLADRSTGFRVIVSLQARHLWVVADDDTLLSAPVAVAKGTTMSYSGLKATFKTPRGARTVLSKDADPVWVPPDWFYYETAEEHGFKVERIPTTGFIETSDGKKLSIQNNHVMVLTDEGLGDFPTNLHVIFGQTLYIPPVGTENRQVAGTLGKYKLNLGDGYMLHGTPDQNSIGLAATHGCVRLRDEDIEWLYENVPVGAKVYIY